MRQASDDPEFAVTCLRSTLDRATAARFTSWQVSTAVLAVASMVIGVATPPRPVRTAKPAVSPPLGPRRVFSRAGLPLSLMGASFLVDYTLQLTVMQPALLTGQLEGLSPLSQYNPHGVFIGVENVGYALLAGAFAPLSSWARCPGRRSSAPIAPLPSSTHAPGRSPAVTGRVIGSLSRQWMRQRIEAARTKDLRPYLDAPIPRTLSTGPIRSP